MIDIVFEIGDLDLHSLLSTYQVSHEAVHQQILTSLDGTEHGAVRYRPVVSFSLIPLTDAQCAALYDELTSPNISVKYHNPYINSTVTANMRVATNLDAIFGLNSADGNRYYKGKEITLRQRTVL